MEKLFRILFSKSGPIYKYPRLNEFVGHQWSLDCDLDSSFEFLRVAKKPPSELPPDVRSFFAFLAGFFDAEGSIYYHKKGNGGGAFELSITNTDHELLQTIASRLDQLRLHSVLRRAEANRESAIESGIANPSEFMWRIVVWRHDDVNRLLRMLDFRHPEKSAKAKIATRLRFRASSAARRRIVTEWVSLIEGIEAVPRLCGQCPCCLEE